MLMGSTLEIFPWRPQQGKVARMICDIHRPDGTPFAGDPRVVLKKAVKEAAKELLMVRNHLSESEANR